MALISERGPRPGPSAATVGLRSLHPSCEHPRPPALAELALPASGSWVWVLGQGGGASPVLSHPHEGKVLS